MKGIQEWPTEATAAKSCWANHHNPKHNLLSNTTPRTIVGHDIQSPLLEVASELCANLLCGKLSKQQSAALAMSKRNSNTVQRNSKECRCLFATR